LANARISQGRGGDKTKDLLVSISVDKQLGSELISRAQLLKGYGVPDLIYKDAKDEMKLDLRTAERDEYLVNVVIMPDVNKSIVEVLGLRFTP
jgi:hypothetical protein